MVEDRFDLLHRYMQLENVDTEGITLQELFDHRHEYLEARDKIRAMCLEENDGKLPAD